MLEVINLSVKFEDFHLQNINLHIRKGDYFVLVGHSGSGKSVLLETIAGLIFPDSGSILMNKSDITFTKTGSRRIGLMFQDNSLFPHLSVKKNIEFALRLKNKDHNVVTQKLNMLAGDFNIGHLLHRNPEILSGGEIQRVLLARTLASEPEILMLDEPLSSIDTIFKDEIKSLLRNLNRKGLTIIHVTHDFEEAIALASKIAVLNDGKLVAAGSPEEIFHNPANEFIARFCGHKNYLKADFRAVGFAVVKNNLRIEIPPSKTEIEQGAILIDASEIILSNEHFSSSARNAFKGKIMDISKSKSGIEVKVDIGVPLIALITHNSSVGLQLKIGQEIWCTFKASSVQIIQ